MRAAKESSSSLPADRKRRRKQQIVEPHANLYLRQMLEADAAENQIYLDAIKRGDLSPRSPQGRAALILGSLRKGLGVGEK